MRALILAGLLTVSPSLLGCKTPTVAQNATLHQRPIQAPHEVQIDRHTLVLLEARKWLGKAEIGSNEELSRLTGVNVAKVPWCAYFVNAILEKQGLRGTDSGLARSYLKWGKATDNPKAGDIVVFQRGNSNWQGHVGFYIKETSTHILVLGGNQDNQVSYKYYPKSKVLGYRTFE